MFPLPAAETLSLSGMGFVALFALWKLQVVPLLERRRAHATAS